MVRKGRRRAGLIWVSRVALASMRGEAAKITPRETGGLLIGFWSGGEPVITAGIGPGPAAVHALESFRPDYDFDEAVIARIWNQTRGQETYLGDWHSHPGASHGGLSRQDRRTLRRIGTSRTARASRPLMIVLHGGDPDWAVSVWEGQPCRVLSLVPCFTASARDVKEF